MDVPTALLSDLAQLADSVDLDAGLLQTPLSALVAELSAAVGSYPWASAHPRPRRPACHPDRHI